MYTLPNFPVSRLALAPRFMPEFLQLNPTSAEILSQAMSRLKEDDAFDVIIWKRRSHNAGYVLLEGAGTLAAHYDKATDVGENSLKVARLNNVFAELIDRSGFDMVGFDTLVEDLEPANWYPLGRQFIAADHLQWYQGLPKEFKTVKSARKYFASLYGCADGSVDKARGLLLSKHPARDRLLELVLRDHVGVQAALTFTALEKSELGDLLDASDKLAPFGKKDGPRRFGGGRLEEQNFNELLSRARPIAMSRWSQLEDRSIIKAASREARKRREEILSPEVHGRKVWKAAGSLRTVSEDVRALLFDPDDDDKLHPYAGQISPDVLKAIDMAQQLLDFATKELEDGAIVERCLEHKKEGCSNCDSDGWHSARSHRRTIEDKCDPFRQEKHRRMFPDEDSPEDRVFKLIDRTSEMIRKCQD